MNDEQTKKTDTSGTEINKPVETVVKPLSIVDEAKAIRDDIIKQKEELKEEREKLEKARSEALLSGTSGGHVEPTPAKEETPKEYNDRIDKEISEGKHGD